MRRLILITLLAFVLVVALTACGGSSGGSETTPASPTPTTTTSGGAAGAGAAIWNAQCAGCHAQDPAGVGVSDAGEVESVVKSGAEGMPSFAGKLTAAQIKAVSEYVAKAAQ